MKTLTKIIYDIRILFFFLHFFLLYEMSDTLWQVKPIIYFFITLHFLFIIRFIYELLSKEQKYKEDSIYNLMSIGTLFYFVILFYRIKFTHMYYMKETTSYFNINLGILCLLWIFLLLYSVLDLQKRD